MPFSERVRCKCWGAGGAGPWTPQAGSLVSFVMDFLDVSGASGTRYRFRRTTLAELPVTAGNVIAVSGSPGKPPYLLCGAARSLNRAGPALIAAIGTARGPKLFIRLNVAGVVRDAEHADIVAAVEPEADLPRLD